MKTKLFCLSAALLFAFAAMNVVSAHEPAIAPVVRTTAAAPAPVTADCPCAHTAPCNCARPACPTYCDPCCAPTVYPYYYPAYYRTGWCGWRPFARYSYYYPGYYGYSPYYW